MGQLKSPSPSFFEIDLLRWRWDDAAQKLLVGVGGEWPGTRDWKTRLVGVRKNHLWVLKVDMYDIPIDMNAGKWYCTSIHDTQSILQLFSIYTSPGHTEEQRQVLYNLPPGKQQNTTLHLGLGRPPPALFFHVLLALFWTLLLYVPSPTFFHVVIPNFPLFQTEEKNRDRYDSASLFLGVQLPPVCSGTTVQRTNRSLIEVMNRHVLLAFFRIQLSNRPLK